MTWDDTWKHWPEIVSSLLSLAALLFSWMAWYKSRAIYGLETAVLRQPTGGHDDLHDGSEELNRKLRSGEYTVLSVMERQRDKDWELLLGRIKSPSNDCWITRVKNLW